VTDSELQRDYQQAIALRASTSRAQCPPTPAIEALAAGEGQEKERLTTLDHVMACPHCQREFELLRAIHAAGKPRAVTMQPRWYALAAVLLLAVALSLFTVRRDGPVLRGPVGTDSLPVPVAPVGDVAAANARLFVWRPFAGAAQYRIEILGSGGALVASASLVDTTWAVADSVALQVGEALQWTVEAVMPDARRLQSPITAFRVR
jgi:hypothetical protein